MGWQAIKLDNLRFVGNVDFRQVMQVFDAAGIENKSIDNLSVYVAYLWRQRNTLGQQIGMQMPVVNLRYGWKPGNDLIAYAYLQNEAKTGQNRGTGFANDSNQIYGVRANGAYPLGGEWKLLYTAEYAKQDSYADGNSLIDADYYHVGIGGKWGEFYARVDQEMLGSNDGKYGFQTPLATLHLFQGWADQFTTTPKEGIRDTYLSAGAKVWKLLFYAEMPQVRVHLRRLRPGQRVRSGHHLADRQVAHRQGRVCGLPRGSRRASARYEEGRRAEVLADAVVSSFEPRRRREGNRELIAICSAMPALHPHPSLPPGRGKAHTSLHRFSLRSRVWVPTPLCVGSR